MTDTLSKRCADMRIPVKKKQRCELSGRITLPNGTADVAVCEMLVTGRDPSHVVARVLR
ncbi:hypothetical protein [Nitrospira sp. KM1]|uniref:hypothetical protein n=1 Tax=Nitrospira sp. KM1 TaxID=1936990 RepID=UPI0015679222|nr:hypothetical protein [Nitrospira sp. KM1]